MFEGYTLGQQKADEIARGWHDGLSANTYSTVEYVVFRKPESAKGVLDCEILIGKRIKGIVDCLNRVQLKWGTQVRAAADRTPLYSAQRGVKESFGWEVEQSRFRLTGVVGPWVHKATASLRQEQHESVLVIEVIEEQGEKTPFTGSLFAFDATGLELGDAGNYRTATENARWVRLRDLITEFGPDSSVLYWSMVAQCFHDIDNTEQLYQYYGPGTHEVWLD